MDPITVEGVEGVRGLIGRELGPGDWIPVTQQMVDRFAEATGDHQWIHVDVRRAEAESPFGGTIAHGFLTLSLIPRLLPRLVEVTGFRTVLNYGLEKVRFPSPVPVGSRVRARAVTDAVTDVPGGVQVQTTVTFEVEGAGRPACVAVSVVRRLL